MKCGLVGFPNVGKSTLFNLLIKEYKSPEGNFPFCTINPYKARVSVPDEDLNKLGKIFKTKKIIPTEVEFIDIAGLVKNASQGEGMGNQFLSTIREVDLIIYVVRSFEGDDIINLGNNPLEDLEILREELRLSDEKLKLGTPDSMFLSKKSVIIFNNGPENSLLTDYSNGNNLNLFNIDIKKNPEFLDSFISQCFYALNYIQFFTCGEKECRSWRIIKGTDVKNAGGKIHSD